MENALKAPYMDRFVLHDTIQAELYCTRRMRSGGFDEQ